MLPVINQRANMPSGLRSVSALSKPAAGKELSAQDLWLVEEDALSVYVEQVGTYTLMWTPTDDVALPIGYNPEFGVCAAVEAPDALRLALGFIFTEGIINSLDDVRIMSICPDDPSIVRVKLFNPEDVTKRRSDVVITSSCGICGGRDALEDNLNKVPQVQDTLRVASNSFAQMMTELQQRQSVFKHSGGSHAAAVFNVTGELLATAEDLGRHNALDKVIGDCLLRKKQLSGKGVLLSSRLSLEMVSKAAAAGFEIIAAVSAPTSLAVKVAEQCGITLCGFVRGERLTVYTHSHRITIA